MTLNYEHKIGVRLDVTAYVSQKLYVQNVGRCSFAIYETKKGKTDLTIMT